MQELVDVFRTGIHRGGATFNARISLDDYLESLSRGHLYKQVKFRQGSTLPVECVV